MKDLEPSTQTHGTLGEVRTGQTLHLSELRTELASRTFLRPRKIRVAAREGPVSDVIEQQPLQRTRIYFMM